MRLSVVMITKNSAGVVGEALKSIEGLWGELLVGDAGSSDGTVEMVKRYGGRIILQSGDNLGKRKQELVKRAKGEWILVLDADERVSEELGREILEILNGSRIPRIKSGARMTNAWSIPYQNYVFGKPVYYGGERYSKVRLFRNGYGRVLKTPLHEEIVTKFHKATPCKANSARGGLKKSIGKLHGMIHHHSYRSPMQLFGKFTRYAWIASPGVHRDRIDILKKLFFYGPHMFWARFIKEKGYRDGWRGFVLALAFAYMETLTYWITFIR